jgi:hypothetical protein
MIETLLSEAMHDGTADLEFDAALLDAAARRNHRRTAVRRSAVAAGALGAVAVAAVAVVPHGSPARHDAVQHPSVHHPVVAPRVHDVAYVAKQLKATLADENDYVIASELTARNGMGMSTWIDPSTGARRLVLDNADGAPNTTEGIVVDNGRATITSLDYATHTVTRTSEPVAVIDASSRLGINVASPSQIRSEINASDLVDKGAATVGGKPAEQYRLLAPQPAGSEIWADGTDVELYVDTTSYQLVRITVGESSGPLYDDHLTWTPRSNDALAETRLSIPSGFTSR